nr:universal stress protein [Kibdelosporangium sp. MJ126-NF4]CEL17552.1 Universal stress protein family [Kibdelosporangium sp. MJ126-NF4]CTQ91222.1 Universal stress protein family [Kibdelosporangium sp. MJ126-NF4]
MSCTDHHDRRHAVIVGFDDSTGARRAAQWAAAEAGARKRPLVIVHALDLHPVAATDAQQPVSSLPDRPRRETTIRALNTLVTETRHSEPDLDVVATLAEADARTAINAVAARLDAELTVLGLSSDSAVPRELFGSTVGGVVRTSDRPTVIVRGDTEPAMDGAVLIGIDGSHSAWPLLDFAFRHAAMHGNAVHAVHATGARVPNPVGPPCSPDPDTTSAESQLDECRARYPDVPTSVGVVDDQSTQAMLGRCGAVSLVAVGRRHDPTHRMMFGPAGHAMLRQALCPVVIVPQQPNEH